MRITAYIMIESRRNSRRIVNKVSCIISLSDSKDIQRKVLNISSGGLLLEKQPQDESLLFIGEVFNFSIIFSDDYSMNIKGKILRKQERSIAIMFININNEQEKFLKAICS